MTHEPCGELELVARFDEGDGGAVPQRLVLDEGELPRRPMSGLHRRTPTGDSNARAAAPRNPAAQRLHRSRVLVLGGLLL
jgi:hypothetical protein